MKLVLIAVHLLFSIGAASAQFDPRPVLGSLISAFQNCGPPQVYQYLSPQLFQIVAAQTGGSGCYQNIAQAGPIVNMQVLNSQNFPVGPLYLVRVQHQQFNADWQIGFNQFTQRVEYLNFQASPPPTPNPGPTPFPPNPPGRRDGGPSPQPPTGTSDGCTKYPAMCARP